MQHGWSAPVVGRDPHFLDSRQELMNPLVKRAGHDSIRRDDVQPLEPGKSRQQIPISRAQPVAVRRGVADSEHDVFPRIGRRRREQPLAKAVLVHSSRGIDELFEVAERADEEPRLAHETFGATIVEGAWFQRAERETLERVDALLMSLERIVEVNDLRDETRAQMERRFVPCLDRRATRRTGQHLALGLGQQTRLSLEPLAQPSYQLSGRDEIGQDDRASGGKPLPFDRLKQVLGGRAGRHDDEPAASIEGGSLAGEVDERCPKQEQIRHSYKPGRARRDHCSFGGSSSSRISC